MDVIVVNCWVTETKETSWASNSSTSFAKSASDLVSPIDLVDHDVLDQTADGLRP
jgi:hypothetical protein